MSAKARNWMVSILTLAVLGTMMVPTSRPAAADAGSFALNGYTYGPNAYVVIDFGTLTRDCDVFWTASDIYVVPAGTVGPGAALSDVSGTPNTIQTALGGGAIIDEVIGFTGPSGTIPEGSYDIVEDTCQDGTFNGSDSVLRNAFTVEFPDGVPPLPSAAIARKPTPKIHCSVVSPSHNAATVPMAAARAWLTVVATRMPSRIGRGRP